MLGVCVWGAAITALLLPGLSFNSAKQRSEYGMARQALLSDRFIKRVLAENKERCADQFAYVWAGGVTIRFARPPGYDLCSTPETPWFAGALTIPAGPEDYRTWVWPQVSPFFLSGEEGCQRDTCPTLTILGGSESTSFVYALRSGPPDLLSDNPVWPDFESVLTYGTWQDGAWARFQGATVRFHFGQVPLGDLRGYQPPVSMLLQHPNYPVLLEVRLPPNERENWRTHLQAALETIDKGVVSSLHSDDGSQPPSAVRFLAEEFNGSLDFLKAWHDSRMMDE